MATEMDLLIEKLKAANLSNNESSEAAPEIALTKILSEISATKDPKLFDKHDLAAFFMNLIKSQDENVRREAAKCIAEITKSDAQRKQFTKREYLEALMNELRDVSEASNLNLPIQFCRAVGNICYVNDDARNIILETKGDEVLIKLLDLLEFSDAENAEQFIKVRSGLLSNFVLGGEHTLRRALELQFLEKLQKLMTIGASDVEKNENLLLNVLPLLSILTDNVTDYYFDEKLNLEVSHILAATTNTYLAEMCLESLHYQAEVDNVKLLLAKDGLCETIYNLLEKHKQQASSDEARALMKSACELIVLILTGDESMHYLYTTPLLKNMQDWLDSDDIDLLTTGVLALGNFARTDSHCIHMVENKTMNKLLNVLAKNNGVKDDVRLQHALLSTLRNLVIPKPNKSAVIEAGLVQTILPMLEIHQPPVVFKLLGTLRMTVDGQEQLALQLLKNKTLIEQLVHWSKSSDYAGVTGESFRLMAWLIKHAYLEKIFYARTDNDKIPAAHTTEGADNTHGRVEDRSSIYAFLQVEGAFAAMVNMLTSQHLVMQNEALVALMILCVIYLIDLKASREDNINMEDDFVAAQVGKKLAELIEKSSETMTKEIVENVKRVFNLITCSPKICAHLQEHNIEELLKSIPILTEYCTL